VLAYCGLRFGELAALRVRNLDPLRRRLHIEESVTEVDGAMIFGTLKSTSAVGPCLPVADRRARRGLRREEPR
jgi:integrase